MVSNPLVILQARMGSSRLPGKIMKIVNGKPIIEWQIRRILESAEINQLVVATTNSPSDEILVKHLNTIGIEVFRGPEHNVLDRFLGVIRNYNPEIILRLTADCPLVMPTLIDDAVRCFVGSNYDYLSNALDETYPDGLDVEVMSSKALLKLETLDLSSDELEHVTLGIYQRPSLFRIGKINSVVNLGNHRWTLDYLEDLEFVQRVYAYFEGRELTFSLNEVLQLLASEPKLQNSVLPNFRNIAIKAKGENNE